MNLSHEIRSFGFSKQSRSAISDDDGRVFWSWLGLVLLVAESSRDKKFQKALNDITRKNSNIGFEYPQKTQHNSRYQKKNTCQNSPLPQKIPS